MMRAKQWFFVTILILLVAGLPMRRAAADVGPKPTMVFNFVQKFDGEAIEIITGRLYECDQPDCSDARELEDLGPQGLYCEPQTCQALAYGFSDYHRIEVEFTDGKIRKSNVFKTDGFNAVYTVEVREADLLVEGQFVQSNLSGLVIIAVVSLCCLLLLAVVLAVGILGWKRWRKNRAS